MNFSEVWFVLCLGWTPTYMSLLIHGRWYPMVLKNRLYNVTLHVSPCENGQDKEKGFWMELLFDKNLQ